MSEDLTFAVVSFKRVFDTEPVQEYLTLDQLGRTLTRFMLRPKVIKALERDLQRLDAAYEAWKRGEEHSGWWARKVAQAVRKAEVGHPEDLARAVEAQVEDIRVHVRKDAKKDLRIWAPALYRPGTRRESENVLHLSALVLDYDDGTPIPVASETWDSWFHIIHSTWSYTPEHHRFRLILPLARPVRGEDWAAVREWAEERTGFAVDPSSGKSPGGQFAQPAVPHTSWPREARIHQGPLLDPVFLGLVEVPAEPQVFPTESTLLRDGDPGYRYIQHEIRAEEIDDEALEDPDLWDPFGVDDAARAEPAPDSTSIEARVASLESAMSRVESHMGGDPGLVGQLERLASLHERGVLTDDELAAAKSRLLTD